MNIKENEKAKQKGLFNKGKGRNLQEGWGVQTDWGMRGWKAGPQKGTWGPAWCKVKHESAH